MVRWLIVLLALGAGAPHRVGVFTDDRDIGTVAQPGGSTFAAGAYRVTGNGDDLWAAKDDFHFLSRPATGDVAIAATLSPASGSTEPHSKAGLMLRQDLTPGSVYADLAVHENGLVALQYRATPGGITGEIALPHTGPGRFGLMRRGRFVSVAVAGADGRLKPVGGAVAIDFAGPYHAGLFVCSHSDTQLRTVTFSNVAITR